MEEKIKELREMIDSDIERARAHEIIWNELEKE